MRCSGCDFWMKKAAVETHLLDKINRSGEGRNGQRNVTNNTNKRPWLDWMMVEVPRDGWGRLVDGDAPRGGQYWSCRWCRRFDVQKWVSTRKNSKRVVSRIFCEIIKLTNSSGSMVAREQGNTMVIFETR